MGLGPLCRSWYNSPYLTVNSIVSYPPPLHYKGKAFSTIGWAHLFLPANFQNCFFYVNTSKYRKGGGNGSIPDPGSGSASKNSGIFTTKTVSKLLEKWSEMFIPDPDFFPIPDPGSRGQKGTGSRIRIRDTGCVVIRLSGTDFKHFVFL